MKQIYILVGEIIKLFQKLEENLALLIYFSYILNCATRNQQSLEHIKEKALEYWNNATESTLGKNLKNIKDFCIFEKENDLLVLTFLKDKRNYVVHNFFKNNNFCADCEIEPLKKELIEIYDWGKLINNAINKMVSSLYYQCKDNIKNI